MSNRDVIVECIEAAEQGICDACIARTTGVSPHQQVNQICRSLNDQGSTSRYDGECVRCSRTLLVNVPYVGAKVDAVSVARKKVTGNTNLASELDELRRFMISRLNALDPGNAREPFTGRIARLRDKGTIPWNIASLALTHASYRNKVHHEGFEASSQETRILALIGEVLREQFK